jgi:transcriptional regulator with XRE-family HTH domain
MAKLNLHWTSKSTDAFVDRLSFDFITQIQQKLEKTRTSRKEFAERLRVSAGRISQVFNAPGNITLETAVDYARGIGMKVALVAYDDSDPDDIKGPINSEVFYKCWQLSGCPQDLSDFGTANTTQMVLDFASYQKTSVNDQWRNDPLPFLVPDTAVTNTTRIGMVQ